VQLAVVDEAATRSAGHHPAVKSIDFTGGPAFGRWLIEHAAGKQVYAELAGVNNVVIESTDNYKGMLRNLAFTLSLYSGQMCTTTKAILVPADGIDTDAGRKSFDEVAADLGAAIEKFLSDPATATCGAGRDPVGGHAQADRRSVRCGDRGAASKRAIVNPEFPQAQVRTPVLLKTEASREGVYMQERFGPICTLVAVPGGADALVALSERIVREQGALTVGVYSKNEPVIDAMVQATQRAGVALSINLTGGVFVNQSAAFSDFHATGANPAANASYADSAFVANRFRVVQRRVHVAPTAAAA
jgi:phenylacetic acid degradation protein paaN